MSCIALDGRLSFCSGDSYKSFHKSTSANNIVIKKMCYAKIDKNV